MTTPFPHIQLKQDFHRLPTAFYAHVKPQGLDAPKLVIASHACADLLGIDPDSLTSADSLALLSGNAIHANSNPIAMKYTGHQFGYFNPDLGDGRGLLLGELESPDKQLWDLHLKGAGTTPFSRQGDGRAVLRSSIREFLCSEAMAGLNIPSTRALCVLNSSTPVYREQKETGATLLRVANTHIRFGHFEYAYHSGQQDLLETLADYVIDRYYPCLSGVSNRYADLYCLIAENTAKMIARWQAVGFAHGVMNTDNMSILGDTFDYGPFGFLDRFEPGYICNHSDHEGRYAFDRQPAIAHWNLSVLAQVMSPLVEKEALQDGLKHFSQTFNTRYIDLMRQKLGLQQALEGDDGFIFTTLNMLSENGLDYSFFFRQLSHERTPELRDHCINREQFDQWLTNYQQRLTQETCSASARKSCMLGINPKYILRNHLAQIAIKQAQQGDYDEVNRLHKILTQPFDEQPEFEHYADLPPDWAQGIEISCSS